MAGGYEHLGYLITTLNYFNIKWLKIILSHIAVYAVVLRHVMMLCSCASSQV